MVISNLRHFIHSTGNGIRKLNNKSKTYSKEVNYLIENVYFSAYKLHYKTTLLLFFLDAEFSTFNQPKKDSMCDDYFPCKRLGYIRKICLYLVFSFLIFLCWKKTCDISWEKVITYDVSLCLNTTFWHTFTLASIWQDDH